MRVDVGNLIAVLILVMFTILMFRSGKPERRDDGTLRLRYTKVYWVSGILGGVVGPTGITVALFASKDLSHQVLLAGIVFAAVLSLIGIPLLVSCIRTYVILDESGILVRTGLGSVKRMAWNDIRHVRFFSWSFYFALQGPSGMTIRFSAGLTGMKEFVEILRIHTSPNVHEQALKEYSAFRRVVR